MLWSSLLDHVGESLARLSAENSNGERIDVHGSTVSHQLLHSLPGKNSGGESIATHSLKVLTRSLHSLPVQTAG